MKLNHSKRSNVRNRVRFEKPEWSSLYFLPRFFIGQFSSWKRLFGRINGKVFFFFLQYSIYRHWGFEVFRRFRRQTFVSVFLNTIGRFRLKKKQQRMSSIDDKSRYFASRVEFDDGRAESISIVYRRFTVHTSNVHLAVRWALKWRRSTAHTIVVDD